MRGSPFLYRLLLRCYPPVIRALAADDFTVVVAACVARERARAKALRACARRT